MSDKDARLLLQIQVTVPRTARCECVADSRKELRATTMRKRAVVPRSAPI